MGFIRQFAQENYDIALSEDFERGFVIAANVLGYAPATAMYKLDELPLARIKALLEPDDDGLAAITQ